MRYFAIPFVLFCLSGLAIAQTVDVEVLEDGVLFSQGTDSVLFYQTAEKALNGTYQRSNYIHPLYTLDGQVLTEDFPEDHLHHRGIFWAWHQLYVGKQRIGDGWVTLDFEWQVRSVEVLPSNIQGKSILSHVVWRSPLWLDDAGRKKPLVSEYTNITVYPADKHYRQIDIQISLMAAEPQIRIGGSEDAKGYGGFSPRVRLPEDVQFTSSAGEVIPQTLPVEAGGWMNISGSLGKDGSMAGIAILNHPENPGYPNPWILRAKNSMQNVVYPHPGAEAIALSPVRPVILYYRLLIHDGHPSLDFPALHDRFGNVSTSPFPDHPAFTSNTMTGSAVFIAHRGGIVPSYPENSLSAFDHAIENGAHAIEIDLRTTKDGEIVILHDETLDRTTNGSGKVSDMTLAELKNLDLENGERIPAYEEVLQLVSGTGVLLLLDIKEGSSEAAKREIIRLTEKYHAVLKVIVGVRNLDDHREFISLNRNLRTLGFIKSPEAIESFIDAGVEIIRLWPDWIRDDPSLVQQVHSMGRPVWSTAGDRSQEEMEKLIHLGVNGILLDRIDVMRSMVAATAKNDRDD